MKLGDWLVLGMILVGIVFSFILFSEVRTVGRWAIACENITAEKDFCTNAQVICTADFSRYGEADG